LRDSLDVLEIRIKNRRTGNKEKIPSWLNILQKGLQSASDQAFRPISFHSLANHFPGNDPNPDSSNLVWQTNHNHKRMSNRLSKATQSLEIFGAG